MSNVFEKEKIREAKVIIFLLERLKDDYFNSKLYKFHKNLDGYKLKIVKSIKEPLNAHPDDETLFIFNLRPITNFDKMVLKGYNND